MVFDCEGMFWTGSVLSFSTQDAACSGIGVSIQKVDETYVYLFLECAGRGRGVLVTPKVARQIGRQLSKFADMVDAGAVRGGLDG